MDDVGKHVLYYSVKGTGRWSRNGGHLIGNLNKGN